MGIKVVFECCGCDRVETVNHPGYSFVSITGKSYGFGSHQGPGIKEVAPNGWTHCDPATALCYCPDCVRDIFGEEDAPSVATGNN